MQIDFWAVLMTWVVLTLLPFPGASQSKADEQVLSLAYDNSKAVYFNSLGSELALHNGISYKEYIPSESDQGIPYFESDDWTEGTLDYNGVPFENIPLLYDVVRDKVITQLSTSTTKLELISEKVKHFEINGHWFVRLSFPESNSQIQTGFFELLHRGQVQLYVKWQKERKKITESGQLEIRYEDQNRIYIHKDNQFYYVKSKSSVLNVLEDKKKLIQKFIRENHLNFKDQSVASISKIIAFYESVSE